MLTAHHTRHYSVGKAIISTILQLLCTLLLSPSRGGATLRVKATAVFSNGAQHLIATVRVREQARTRPHIRVVIEGDGTIIVNQMIEKLSVSAVKRQHLRLHVDFPMIAADVVRGHLTLDFPPGRCVF